MTFNFSLMNRVLLLNPHLPFALKLLEGTIALRLVLLSSHLVCCFELLQGCRVRRTELI